MVKPGLPFGQRCCGFSAAAGPQQRSSQQQHGSALQCSALKDRVANANRTITRRVQVPQKEDFANTPARRYIFFTGFPFPIGPLVYRKTTCREVRMSCGGVILDGECLDAGLRVLNSACVAAHHCALPTDWCMRNAASTDVTTSIASVNCAAIDANTSCILANGRVTPRLGNAHARGTDTAPEVPLLRRASFFHVVSFQLVHTVLCAVFAHEHAMRFADCGRHHVVLRAAPDAGIQQRRCQRAHDGHTSVQRRSAGLQPHSPHSRVLSAARSN